MQIVLSALSALSDPDFTRRTKLWNLYRLDGRDWKWLSGMLLTQSTPMETGLLMSGLMMVQSNAQRMVW